MYIYKNTREQSLHSLLKCRCCWGGTRQLLAAALCNWLGKQRRI